MVVSHTLLVGHVRRAVREREGHGEGYRALIFQLDRRCAQTSPFGVRPDSQEH